MVENIEDNADGEINLDPADRVEDDAGTNRDGVVDYQEHAAYVEKVQEAARRKEEGSVEAPKQGN